MSKKRLIFLIAGIVAFVLCGYVIPVPESLAAAAVSVGSSPEIPMVIIGATALAICWWMGNVFCDWLTTVAMMILWVVAGKFAFAKAFSPFAGTTIWTIIGAFGLSAAVTKSGLFKRFAYFLIRLFSPTYNGMLLALLLVGTVCTPLIPSSTAKAILGATISKNISDAIGYEKFSSERVGLFIASWIGFSTIVPAFLSAGVFNYTICGALPEEIRATVTWGSWFTVMLPWLVMILIGSFLLIPRVYRRTNTSIMSKEYFENEYKKLGPLSLREKEAGIILITAVLCWVFESQLGISAVITALGAMFFCFALGILDLKEVATAIPWGLIIFVGGVLNLGSIFTIVGISAWMQNLLAPMSDYITNPVVIVVATSAIVVAIRLILASQAAVIVLMLTILGPVVQANGFNPLMLGIMTYVAAQCWFVPYQNGTYAPAFSVVSDGIHFNQTVKACFVFQIMSLIAFLVCIPYWTMLGYIN